MSSAMGAPSAWGVRSAAIINVVAAAAPAPAVRLRWCEPRAPTIDNPLGTRVDTTYTIGDKQRTMFSIATCCCCLSTGASFAHGRVAVGLG